MIEKEIVKQEQRCAQLVSEYEAAFDCPFGVSPGATVTYWRRPHFLPLHAVSRCEQLV